MTETLRTIADCIRKQAEIAAIEQAILTDKSRERYAKRALLSEIRNERAAVEARKRALAATLREARR